MNFNIEFKDFTPQKRIQKLIQELVAKTEKKTNGLSPDVAFLRLLLEENSARKLYRVSINLKLSGKTLVAKEGETQPRRNHPACVYRDRPSA
jgi:hypothetical protein